MKALWVGLLLGGIAVNPLFAETSEGEVYEETEEIIEEFPDEPAQERVEANPRDPASASLKDEVNFLRAQVVSLRNAVENLQKKSPDVDDESPSKDVKDVLDHIAPQPSARMKKFDAHSEEEAKAMEEAEKKSHNLPNGPMQRDFNGVQKAYSELLSMKPDQLTAKLGSFRKLCDTYIKKYETDPSSRSALYYLGHVLFVSHHYKESLNVLARVYKGDEDGPHAADALLYMAQIFHKEKKTDAALKFLEKITKDFRPEYLTSSTKELFERVAKEIGSKLTLSKQNSPKSGAQKKDASPKASEKPKNSSQKTEAPTTIRGRAA